MNQRGWDSAIGGGMKSGGSLLSWVSVPITASRQNVVPALAVVPRGVVG